MINTDNSKVKFALGIIQHFNPKRYWKMREYVLNFNESSSFLKKIKAYWYLFRIKRADAFNNASLGTNIGFGARFASQPRFPHGLNGIIISPYAVIGKNAYIFQQVTIGDDGIDYRNVPVIGDNVTIYAGAKVIGQIHIGDGAKIGANAVVNFDVPPHSIVCPIKPVVKQLRNTKKIVEER